MSGKLPGSFWRRWVLANTAGFTVGLFLGWNLGGAIGSLAYITLGRKLVFIAFGLTGGAIGGTAIGTVQWLVLRQQVAIGGWWVLATAAGVAASLVVNVAMGNPMGLIAMGLPQWLLLREKANGAIWWILATAIGGLLGGTVCFVVGLVLGLLTQSNGFIGGGITLAAAGISGGMVYGAITGLALLWVLRGADRA